MLRLRWLLPLLVVLSIWPAWQLLQHWLHRPLPVGTQPAVLEVRRGQAFSDTVDELAARGWVEHPALLRVYARLSGDDRRMRAGEYRIEPGTTIAALLEQLARGEVVQYSVTFVEGWTFRDVRRALAEQPKLVQTLEGVADGELMASLGEPERPPEGLFFPDTYSFDKGTEDVEILRRAREAMREKLDRAWSQRASDLPLSSPYEALVLASIVEKETALASERARIAGVFTTRLRRGMRLQTDPTVIYGIGPSFDGNLRRSDLERDGPYNTYTRTGLPPTPIAMPGEEALLAAVRPDERGELYFVATGLGDGSHAFSRTLGEHEAAVREYLARLRLRRQER